MKSINIKGREYFPVSERLKAFHEDYKELKILTSILNITENWVVMKADIIDKLGEVLCTGHASEVREGNINKTSYVENCETSAVGRALGLFGIGSDKDIASADEVALARDAEADQIEYIEKLLRTSTLDDEQQAWTERQLPSLTYAKAEKIIERLQQNQRDPIDGGENYNQGDIQKKLDRVVGK
jgi:hypothetical protein